MTLDTSNWGSTWGQKYEGQSYWGRKCKSLLCISSWKIDRLTSNYDQIGLQPILRISSNTFNQRKRVLFAISV